MDKEDIEERKIFLYIGCAGAGDYLKGGSGLHTGCVCEGV